MKKYQMKKTSKKSKLPRSLDEHARIRRLRRKQFWWDTFAGFLGGSTLAGALVEGYYYYYEARELIYFDEPQAKGNTYAIKMGTPNESAKLFYIRTYIAVASAFLVAALIARYLLERKIQIATLKAKKLWDPKKYRFAWRWMIIEVLYALLFLPPYVNGVYVESETGVNVTTDMLITTLMTGRIYLIGRTLYQFSVFHSEKANSACANTDISLTPWFVFKSELKSSPFILVGTMLVLLFFIFGFGLRQCELPYQFVSNFDWDFIMNGVWDTFLTVTTVGYGDIFPATSLGRVFCVIAAMLGSFFTSLLVIAISSYFSLSMKERNAVFRLKRRLALQQLQGEAVTFIHWAWKYAFFVRPLRIYSKKHANRIHYKLCTSFAQFKERRQKIWQDGEFAISEMDRGYYAVSDALSRNLMKTEMIMWDVRVFQERLALFEKRQTQIEKMVDILHHTYSNIQSITAPCLAASGRKAVAVTFGDMGSMLLANMQSIKQIKTIVDEVPYKFLSTKIINAFRFRRQEFGLLSMRRMSMDTLKRNEEKRSTRVIHRLDRVAENTEAEDEKKELIKSGAALEILKSLFGNEKAKKLYAEMKNADSKKFAKLTTELIEQFTSKSGDKETTSLSGSDLSPRSGRGKLSMKSLQSIRNLKSYKQRTAIFMKREEETDPKRKVRKSRVALTTKL